MSRRRKVKQLNPKTNKKKKRHSSRAFLYVCIGFFVSVVLVILSLTVLFPIENIQVSGKSRYDAQQIIDISGIEKGQNLILTSEKKASSLITKNLPYISTVKLKKKLPSTVTILVENAKTKAQIEQEGKFILFDEDWKILEVNNKHKKNVPIVRGLKTNEEEGSLLEIKNNSKSQKSDVLSNIFEYTKAEGINKITVIKLKNTNDVNITYDDRIVLQCGSSNNLDIKMKYAKRVIAEKEHSEQSGILNLSRIPSEKQQAYFTACELSDEQISVVSESKEQKSKK